MMVQISVDGDVRTATITMINDGVEGVLTAVQVETRHDGSGRGRRRHHHGYRFRYRLDTEKEISRARLNKSQRRAMELLERCIGDEGEPAPNDIEYPQRVRVVPLERWRITCQKGGLSPAGTKESAEKAFQRAQRDLVAMHGSASGTGGFGSPTNEPPPDRPDRQGQTRTKSDFVRGPIPDRHGHTPIGVSVIRRTMSLRKAAASYVCLRRRPTSSRHAQRNSLFISTCR